MKRLCRIGFAVLLLSVAVMAAQAGPAGSGTARQVMLVLDASGSMWAQVDGRSRMATAKQAIQELLLDWETDTAIGLMSYGHRRKGDCGDIELRVPPGRLQPADFLDNLAAIRPRGKTPLAEAVRRAAEAMQYRQRPATVILLSDGMESCGADPCATGRELAKNGADFTVHVIGFQLSEADAVEQLRCLAVATGGVFLGAADAGQLHRALVKAADPRLRQNNLRVQALPEEGAKPGAGAQWHIYALNESGEAAPDYLSYGYSNPQDFSLPPGDYLVRVKLGEGQAEQRVSLKAGESKQLSLVVGVGRVILEAVDKAGGSRLPGAQWHIYALDAQGKPGKDYVTYGYSNPQDFTLPQGDYLARLAVGAAQVDYRFRVKAGDKQSLPVVAGAGQVSLEALDKAGGERLSGVQWHVYALDAQGKPGRDYVTYGYSNPQDFILPQGPYLVRVSAGAAAVEKTVHIKAGDNREQPVVMHTARLTVRAPASASGKLAGSVQWKIFDAGKAANTQDYLTYGYNNPQQFVLPQGKYRITVTLDSGRREQTVTLKAGDSKSLTLK